MNEKLAITGSADLLAAVPHVLGMHPTESFVVLTARAGALGAALRVDAPAEAEPLDYAQMLATYAANDEKATASYVIVYSGETAGDGQSHPYAEHVAVLTNELATARMPVRNVWLVAGTYWAGFGADEKLPLDAIKDSNANATLTYLGSVTDIDVYNPVLLGNWVPRVEVPEGTEEDLGAACETWATVLDSTDMLDTNTSRSLAAAFQHKFIRDCLFRDTITSHNGSFGDVMMGKFTGCPDWARVDRAEAIAFEMMKAVPAGQRAPMLSLLGWLEWLKGHGTLADRYLKLATEDVPGFRLGVLMRELINRGYIADVARDPDTSYKRPMI